MRLRAGVPILRIFDVDRAKDFYLGYVGMKLDFPTDDVGALHAELRERRTRTYVLASRASDTW